MILTPQPAVCSRPTHLCASRDGNLAVLAGSSAEVSLVSVSRLISQICIGESCYSVQLKPAFTCGQEPELLRVGLLDLHGKRGQVLQKDAATGACTAQLFEEAGFSARPGLQVLQMRFHPGLSHLAPWCGSLSSLSLQESACVKLLCRM